MKVEVASIYSEIETESVLTTQSHSVYGNQLKKLPLINSLCNVIPN